MNAAIKWAVILAVVVTAMDAAVIIGGMHKNPVTGSIIPIALAIIINVVVVFLALRSTADEENYVGQLRNGLVIGVVGGVLIGIGAWIMLSFVFPNAITEMQEGAVALLRTTGLPEDEIQAHIESMQRPTPFDMARPGTLGTLATSILAAAVIGMFVRKK